MVNVPVLYQTCPSHNPLGFHPRQNLCLDIFRAENTRRFVLLQEGMMATEFIDNYPLASWFS
jgi:hypothetical protein